MIRSSVHSDRARVPVIAPSCITATRSLMSRISSMSLLIMRIATPARGEVAHQHIDFGFGADVDAARRFVEDQHLRAEREPLRQHDLLLIAAAQIRRLDFDGRRLDLRWLQRH